MGDYPDIANVDADALSALLRAASVDPAALLRMRHAVAALDVVVDATTLADLRDRLAAQARALREQDEPEVLATARALLDETAALLSPVAVRLREYFDAGSADLTPAAVHALGMLDTESRTATELARRLEREPSDVRRILDEMVRIGVLLQYGAPQRSGSNGEDEPAYRLTPIGAAALPSMAQRVLDLELGRFPWPTTITAPDVWAQRENGQFWFFERRGRDNEMAALCMALSPVEVGPLSAPHLQGVARLRNGAILSTIALLPTHLVEQSSDEAIRGRVRGVVDDHCKVRDRIDALRDHWRLELFAEPETQQKLGGLVEATCAEAHLSDEAYAFAA